MSHLPVPKGRSVRYIADLVRCPDCDKPHLGSIVQAGWGFQKCGNRGRCNGEWWALSLPPDCFGGWLAGVVGEEHAARMIRQAWPEHRLTTTPALWAVILNEGDRQAWIQVSVKSHERHQFRTTPIRQFLNALLPNAS